MSERKVPLFTEAVCEKCGDGIYRYRWETRDRDWLHRSTSRNSCQRVTRAKAAK